MLGRRYLLIYIYTTHLWLVFLHPFDEYKSSSYVNLSLKLHIVSGFWFGSGTSGTFSLYFAQPPHELERLAALKMHILWCKTDICSCKHSAKVSFMFENPFPIPSLCKLNHISVCFTQISTKIICKQVSGKAMFFWSYRWCFGPLGKFQHNIDIYIKTRLSLFLVTMLKQASSIDQTQTLWPLENPDLECKQPAAGYWASSQISNFR